MCTFHQVPPLFFCCCFLRRKHTHNVASPYLLPYRHASSPRRVGARGSNEGKGAGRRPSSLHLSHAASTDSDRRLFLFLFFYFPLPLLNSDDEEDGRERTGLERKTYSFCLFLLTCTLCKVELSCTDCKM